ncbi:unnamed protein product [Pocillopora meandrina]|uniref:Uncharacterized protein n=1 Tax=Pocillopora meandrina TaxID=46732 RepID=A0AAU9X109_9CNID|nr:unnamed protein product [Pocillopora meandrina]
MITAEEHAHFMQQNGVARVMNTHRRGRCRREHLRAEMLRASQQPQNQVLELTRDNRAAAFKGDLEKYFKL